MRKLFLLRLSTCEKEIMGILWSAGKSLSTNEVLEMWPADPKPSYNTLATHLTRLTHKNFVEHRKRQGDKTLYYSPIINRARYQQRITLSICMLTLICISAVAGIIVTLPYFGIWKDARHEEEPKTTPVIKQQSISSDTIDVVNDEKQIVPQPSFNAEYEGGMEGVQEYFEQHWQSEHEGRVYLQLTIDETGRVTDAKALLDPSTNPELAKEAETVAMQMPQWKPAMNKGVKVKTKVTIAVVLIND